MQRKRDGLVPVGQNLANLGDPVKTLCKASPQARHYFTQADQVNQHFGAREADADLGFMARLMAATVERSEELQRQVERLAEDYRKIAAVLSGS